MLFKTVLSRESEIKIEMRKASFGGDRSEAGRYAANIRWQRQRGESKSETKGSLPLIFQPTWDEAEAKKTGRPWAPLLEENYPPYIKEAIEKVRAIFQSALEAQAEWEKLVYPKTDDQLTDSDKELNKKISELDDTKYQELQKIESLAKEYAASLKLDDYGIQQVSKAIFLTVQFQIGVDRTDYKNGFFNLKPVNEFVNGSQMRVVINVPPEILVQILKDGRIKSQFETGHSSGTMNPTLRSQAETKMFGLHPTVTPENRPIYGHVMNEGIDQSIRRVARHYGTSVVVLKKDVVERTTFTVGDSLGNATTPSRIMEPTNASFGVTDRQDDGYTEAQIHGQVKINDIAYIVVQEGSVSSALKAQTSKIGIPIVEKDFFGYEKFKIEETGDMTKTVGRLIAVRGDGHKLFHTHTETQPLSNMVMRLGFLENENGERLDVNVDSALRYGYWEEPNSLADLIKATFGGDRSEAGRYAANIRWQNNAKDKGTGFVSPTKMKETLLREGLGRNMLLSDVEIIKESSWDWLAQMVGRTTDFVKKEPEESFRTPELRAKLAKREVVKGIVAGMQDITVEEIKLACDELGIDSNLDSNFQSKDIIKQDLLTKFAQHFVDQWANTSNDHETDSLMVQEVVKRVFNLQDATSVDSLENYSDIKNVQKEAEFKLGNNRSLEKALTALVKAQYANTQAYLASKGITEVVIFRGMNHVGLAEDLKDYRLRHFYKMEERGEIVLEERDGVSADDRNSDIIGNISEEEFDKIVPEGVVKVSMKMRPLSSFSLERGIANSFRTSDGSQGSKDEGVFLATRVPVARIFATPFTGVGCLDEAEFVILGGELDAKASRSSSGDEDFDYDNMFPSRKEEIKSYG